MSASDAELILLSKSLPKRKRPRARLSPLDRLFWTVLHTTWSHWRDALEIVKPETVVGWHRAGFRLYWRWKSRPRGGRPRITPELRGLIRRLAHTSVLSPLVVVSETAARRLWPRENPIGKTFRHSFDPKTWFQVIGLVNDVREFTLDDEFLPMVSLPYWHAGLR